MEVNEISAASFEAFLQRARANTWASGAEPTRVTAQGETQYEYKEEARLYRDTYMGTADSFFGQETVYEVEMPLWNIIYAGQVHRAALADPGPDAIYAFLRRALIATGENSRLGRQAHYEEGDWVYTDQGETHGNEFWGNEWVSYRGTEVYRLKYGGGWIG